MEIRWHKWRSRCTEARCPRASAVGAAPHLLPPPRPVPAPRSLVPAAAAREHALAILQGAAEHVADALEQQADAVQLSEHKRAGVDKAVGYLRAKLPYLGYDIALAEGWPIATGVIEGACPAPDQGPNGHHRRPLGPGRREAVLKLRAVISNGDFEAYWEYHAQREHLRVHAVRYRDALELAA